MNVHQLRIHVVRPALQYLDKWSVAAERLVIGTAVHESGGLKYIDQITGPDDQDLGPAYGLFQIEPATYNDLQINYLARHPSRQAALMAFVAPEPSVHVQLATNLLFGAAVCRLVYYRRPEPLPEDDDIEGLARYWKKHYNTSAGKGTAATWLLDYRQYVKD